MLNFSSIHGIEVIVSASPNIFNGKQITFSLARKVLGELFMESFVLNKDQFKLTNEQFADLGIYLMHMFEELSSAQHYSIINYCKKLENKNADQ